MRRPRGALGAAVALALALTGCGHSGTAAERSYIARADAACAAGERQIRAVPVPSTSGSRGQQLRALAGYLQSILPVYDRLLADLRVLPAPAANRTLLERYLGALAQGERDYRRFASAVAAGDAPGLIAARSSLASNQAGALGRRYGFRTCSTAGFAA